MHQQLSGHTIDRTKLRTLQQQPRRSFDPQQQSGTGLSRLGGQPPAGVRDHKPGDGRPQG